MKTAWDRIKDALILAVNAKVGVTFTIYEADALLTIMKAYDELEAENAALREQVRWIPVSERLPEYGRAVLIMTTTSVVPRIGVHSPTIPQWATTDLLYYHDISYSQVTHWMLLPQPPEGE